MWVIGLIVWVLVVVFWLGMCKTSAQGDRLNEEMKAYNERTGWRWH